MTQVFSQDMGMDEEAHGHNDDAGDSDDDTHMGAAIAQHAMPPPQPPVQP